MIALNLASFLLLPLAVAMSCGEPTAANPIASMREGTRDTVDRPVGGPCDGCDLMYEGMPPMQGISKTTTLAGNNEPGERMDIHGRVLHRDGKTPAANIVLYVYHTNAAGLYAPADTQTKGRRNGRLRGWVKTGSDGSFTLHSIRPAPYPGRAIPAHIHILVKEPGLTRYYIDEVWFDDDPLVTQQLRSQSEHRGGDLLVHLSKNNEGIWTGNLTIFLGRNIPGYR